MSCLQQNLHQLIVKNLRHCKHINTIICKTKKPKKMSSQSIICRSYIITNTRLGLT